MKSYGVTIQMKATEQYLLVVLFILFLYMVVQHFSISERKILFRALLWFCQVL